MVDTMLQYYLGITNPEDLSDDEWANKFEQLKEIRKKEAEGNEASKYKK